MVDKVILQLFIFPQGIIYNREMGRVQTFEINSIFSIIPDIARLVAKIKKGDSIKFDQIPALVTSEGFKPSTSTAVMWCTIQLCYEAILSFEIAKIINYLV